MPKSKSKLLRRYGVRGNNEHICRRNHDEQIMETGRGTPALGGLPCRLQLEITYTHASWLSLFLLPLFLPFHLILHKLIRTPSKLAPNVIQYAAL